MELKLINSDEVELITPFCTDGTFRENDPEFWADAKKGYKIYLLRENYAYEDSKNGDTLFWVDTGFITCLFRGRML